ncbi:hypothetical protein H7K36_00800 [Mycolicibacterium litorale]|nr:hypothetical protein [Mycolicibacterium litorale]
MSLASAVVAVVALCLAGWSLLRSGDDETDAGSFSDAQRAEAKAKTCGAIELVRRGVSRNTNLVVPGGPADIAGNLASAANARLALYDGGQYLIDRLEPATPSDIADAARGFADTLMDIAAAATAGSLDSDPNQVARRKSADEANTKLGELCK